MTTKDKQQLIKKIEGLKAYDFKYFTYEKIDGYLIALDKVIELIKETNPSKTK